MRRPPYFAVENDMSTQAALSFFLAIFIFGITPGPGVFAILSRAMSEDASACFSLALGMTISDIVYLIFACLGLAAVATHYGDLFTLIRVIGGAYLCYLGYRLWTAPIPATEKIPQAGRSHWQGFAQGFLISASNPKVILFYIAFLPTFMDLGALTAADIVLAAVLTLLALMSGLMLIAVGVSHMRRRFVTPDKMQALNRTAGGIMFAAGTYLISRR